VKIEYGTWRAYAGSDALLLALVLLIICGGLAYLGTRFHQPVGISRPGRTVSVLLLLIWGLAFASLVVAAVTYYQAMVQQIGPYTPPDSPVGPITTLAALGTFIIIAVLSRHDGLKLALGAAIAGTIAAPMIFELPFDLIVMWRTYPPEPATQFTLLFFLPLFIWELASYSLLTMSPLSRVSKYTLFSLAAMFLVFAVWALFGFSYPSEPIPFVLNAVSKIICFVVAITLFLPRKAEVKMLLLHQVGAQP
jgi:hypothetical protein